MSFLSPSPGWTRIPTASRGWLPMPGAACQAVLGPWGRRTTASTRCPSGRRSWCCGGSSVAVSPPIAWRRKWSPWAVPASPPWSSISPRGNPEGRKYWGEEVFPIKKIPFWWNSTAWHPRNSTNCPSEFEQIVPWKSWYPCCYLFIYRF